MKINDKVKVIKTKMIGDIVEVQKSLNDKNIYIVQFSENMSEGFFEEELELI